jgi:uncharacterized phage protein (TIGR02218 family)
MKTATSGLKSFLAQYNQAAIAEVYTITLADGTVLYYTTADQDIVYNGYTFISSGFLMRRGAITEKCGTDVSEMKLNIYPTTLTIGSLGFVAACHNGIFDYAEVKLERLYFDYFGGTYKGSITKFDGLIVNEIIMERDHAEITVSSYSYLLGLNWPINLYESTCIWQLYSSPCGLSKASFTSSGAVATYAGNSLMSFYTNLSQADDYFDGGVIYFTSGANTGETRTINQHYNADGLISLIIALPNIPASGDTFTIYPGCDHQRSTCKNKFNNFDANGYIRFRGFPFIPSPETAT